MYITEIPCYNFYTFKVLRGMSFIHGKRGIAMKQKKADFFMRCTLLCAVCAVLCAGCGSEEEEHVQALVPVVTEWALSSQCF